MLKKKISKIVYITTLLSAIPFSLTFGATGEIDGNAVRLRSEPTTDSKIIMLLEKGKKVEILSKENDWYKVKVSNSTGYVSESLIKNISEEVVTAVATPEAVKPVATPTVDQTNENVKILAVIGSTVNLRKEPSTSAKVLGKVVEGDNLISEGKTEDGEWYKVKFGDIEGYVFAEYVTEDITKITGEGKVNDGVNFRTEPTTESEIISTIPADADITILGTKEDWYKVLYNEQEGWIVARCVDRVTSTSRSGANSVGRKVVELAKQHLGKKYVWGANGPNSFDCSGLTKYVYGKVGVTLERVSYNQATQGIKVDKSKLQLGDLVFFSGINSTSKNAKISHVGIYIGSGKFIHAANSKRGVVIDELDSDYYKSHYVTARRVIR